jgi:amino acid transporter
LNLFWSALIVLCVTAGAVTVLLLVRRSAPEGSYFQDGDRASGVFGVIATGFAILLGLVVVLAFTSYDASRSGAEAEALTVAQQFETAQFLPPAAGRRLGDELVCYAQSVVHQEWPRMEQGTQGDAINPWAAELFGTLKTVDPKTAVEQAAYSKWLDQTSDREQGRIDRVHGAVGVIPTPLWIVLFLSAILIFWFMLFFADSGERAIVQGTLIGVVAAVITSTLLVIGFLNHPFHPGVGSLRPVAMERTLHILDQERRVVGQTGPLPCDDQGVPTG